jgi:hypothetical protein
MKLIQRNMSSIIINYNNYSNLTKNPLTCGEWLKDLSGGKKFQDDLTDVEKDITDLTEDMDTLLDELGDKAIKEAIDDLKNDNYTYIDGSTPVKHPRIMFNGNLAIDKGRWDKYSSNQYDFESVPIDGSYTIETPWRTIYDNKVDYKCFNTNVKCDVDTVRIISDTNYSLKVYFKGFQSYKISFGDWLDMTFVNPDTAEFPSGGQINSDSFFGLNGTLHTIPSEIWIAYTHIIHSKKKNHA